MEAGASGTGPMAQRFADGSGELTAEDATIELRPDQLPRGKAATREHGPTGGPDVPNPLPVPGAVLELAGRSLGDFKLVRALGSGATGCVYLAEQISLSRPVALKVLSGTRALQPEFIARFRREARAVARLIHPNAVQVYCVGQEGGYHFIALEYVDGQDLSGMLATRKRIPWKAALEIARQSCQALIRAHHLGIVHRDIKPENILINRHADVKLADFGLARLEGCGAITEHGGVLGTPLYMSPEQARGRRAGPASDLYSLGCVLYHMLTGRPPFITGNAIEILRRHVEEAPPEANRLLPELPRPVVRLVMRLLAKEPRDRPSSARSLSTAIARTRRAIEGEQSMESDSPEEQPPSNPAPRPDLLDKIREVALSRAGMRELLAMEATCSCLIPRPRRAFLEATMRNYRIPREKMLPLLEKPRFSREDVWDLQELKRAARDDRCALEAIARLRELEVELGRGLLQACIRQSPPPGGR